MVEPVLYSFRRCPYAMRARLVITVSETRCELREIKLSAKPEAMLIASPKGTVPVLVQPDGAVIDQSLDIVLYVLQQNDPEGWLDRYDADLIARNDGPFKRDLDRYKYPERHASDALTHRAAGFDFLLELEGRLTKTAFLSGNARGLSDAAIAPFVRQFAEVNREWFDSQRLPHLQLWLANFLASPLFTAIMVRVPTWAPGDTPVYFPA